MNAWNEFSYSTAIHHATVEGLLSIALLLKSGANVEASCPKYGTPIMTAILKRNIPALRYPIKNGANANMTSSTEYTLDPGTSPFEFATSLESIEMMRILLESGLVHGLEDVYMSARNIITLSYHLEIMHLLDQQRSKLRNDQSPVAEKVSNRRPRSKLRNSESCQRAPEESSSYHRPRLKPWNWESPSIDSSSS